MNNNAKLIFFWAILAAFCLVQAAGSAPAAAAITTYFNNLAGFNAAAGNPPIAINFDGIAKNTDITNTTIQGVKFEGPGAVLKVVDQADMGGWLFATSGVQLLSPGGTDLDQENDDLTLIFTNPVSAFGFDLIYRHADGASYTAITILDPLNNVLYANDPIDATGTGIGQADFWGFVSDSQNIAKIIIDEFDPTAIDDNIGFDTFRFQTTAAPIPGSMLLLASGLVGLAGWRGFKKS